MAVEPTGPAMDRRVLESLPVETANARRKSVIQLAPRRTLALGLSALLLTITMAAGVAAFFFRSSGASDFTLDGRTWKYRSDFVGEVTFRDAHGHQVGGVIGMGDGQPGTGKVDLDVQGQHYHFNTPGEHPVRDAKGQLLGAAVLRISPPASREATLKFLAQYGIQRIPETPAEIREVQQKIVTQHWDTWGTEKQTGSNGIQNSPLGVLGYDNTLGIYWKVKGRVKVRVLDASGDQVGAAGYDNAQGTYWNINGFVKVRVPEASGNQVGGGDTNQGGGASEEAPEVTAIVSGQNTTMHGYGLHELRNGEGRLLLMLKVERLAPQ